MTPFNRDFLSSFRRTHSVDRVDPGKCHEGQFLIACYVKLKKDQIGLNLGVELFIFLKTFFVKIHFSLFIYFILLVNKTYASESVDLNLIPTPGFSLGSCYSQLPAW